MKKRLLYLIILLSFSFFHCNDTDSITPQGHLIIIGGGKRPVSVMQKFVELARGENAQIAIIPMASGHFEEAGDRYEEEFIELGVHKAKAFHIHNREEADADSVLRELENYSGIFFGGGDQRRLTEIFLNTRCQELFLRKYRDGAVIGGTSAGAAIISSIMITGDGTWEVLKVDSVATTPGLGFVRNAIIDQHFVARSRFNRLLTVSIQHNVMGIGIDENTAIWVKPDRTVDVLGESVVLVLDPQNAQMPERFVDNLLTVQDLKLSVYRASDSFKIP